jgi:ribosomal protein L37E
MNRRTVVGTMHCPDCERRLANVQGYETCADCGYVRPLDRSFPAR